MKFPSSPLDDIIFCYYYIELHHYNMIITFCLWLISENYSSYYLLPYFLQNIYHQVQRNKVFQSRDWKMETEKDLAVNAKLDVFLPKFNPEPHLDI